MFYTPFILFALMAALFVLWPVFARWFPSKSSSSTKTPDADDDAGEIARALYRARFTELTEETVDPTLLSELQTELGAVYLFEPSVGLAANEIRSGNIDQALPSNTNPAQTSSRLANKSTAQSAALFLVVTLALAIPGLGLALYFSTSDPTLLEMQGAERVLGDIDEPELQAWRAKLEARAQLAPGEDMNWYLLGRVYLQADEFTQAEQAFVKAHAVVGDELNVLLYWLQARYLSSRGYLDDFSQSLADKLLMQHPDFPVVLEMMALDAFRREQFSVAISFLNRALNSSSNPAHQQVFATAIQQVRANMRQQGSPILPGISVAVSAATKLPDAGVVFVVARPVGGGMPYAVVQRPVGSVPFEVRLDDMVAMSEARKLSEAESFEVLVRVSRSGNAIAQSGDWSWRSDVMTLSVEGEAPRATLNVTIKPPN